MTTPKDLIKSTLDTLLVEINTRPDYNTIDNVVRFLSVPAVYDYYVDTK